MINLPEGYEFREGQEEFVEEASHALDHGEVFYGNAPCGVGKSLASLLATLPRLDGSKLIICYRTRSQLAIYLKELKKLNFSSPVASLINKQDMCPRYDELKMKGERLSYFNFLEQCMRLKKNSEKALSPYCSYYRNVLYKRGEADALALKCVSEFLAPEEAAVLMKKNGFCPYEALKNILGSVKVFLGTYHYAFNPPVRDALLKNLEVDLSQVLLVVDEAHNLPGFSRELLSDHISTYTIQRSIFETGRFENEMVDQVASLLDFLRVAFERRESLDEGDVEPLTPAYLDRMFHSEEHMSGLEAAETLHGYGEYVKKVKRDLGYVNFSSSTHRVGEFLTNFFKWKTDRYFHMFKKERGNIHLEVNCLDGREISDPVLRGVKGAILMSGTLSPLHVYRDLTLYSAEGTCLKEFENPFPKENRLILLASDVSSRYERRTTAMYARWKSYIEAVSEANWGNVAVFFPSYELMNRLIPLIETDRTVIVEERKTRRDEVMKRLGGSGRNILYAVMGAKLSEGIDYPGSLLTCAVTVGLPYAKWSPYQKALIRYYSQIFPGRGRLYAYTTPAVLRLVQTCGRVHRSASDKGCIVILDGRAGNPSIKSSLPKYFREETVILKSPEECGERIRSFWNRSLQEISKKATGFSHVDELR